MKDRPGEHSIPLSAFARRTANLENDIDPYRLVRRAAAVLEMVRDVADLPERVFLTTTYDEERWTCREAREGRLCEAGSRS